MPVVFFYLSALSFILFPVFINVLLLVWLLLFFYISFVSLCHPGYLRILYIWCSFSIYTGISVSAHSFLVLGVDHMLHAVILLVTFWRCLSIFLNLLYMLSSFLDFLGKLCCAVGSHCLSLIYILHFTALLELFSVFITFCQLPLW